MVDIALTIYIIGLSVLALPVLFAGIAFSVEGAEWEARTRLRVLQAILGWPLWPITLPILATMAYRKLAHDVKIEEAEELRHKLAMLEREAGIR